MTSAVSSDVSLNPQYPETESRSDGLSSYRRIRGDQSRVVRLMRVRWRGRSEADGYIGACLSVSVSLQGCWLESLSLALPRKSSLQTPTNRSPLDFRLADIHYQPHSSFNMTPPNDEANSAGCSCCTVSPISSKRFLVFDSDSLSQNGCNDANCSTSSCSSSSTCSC